MRIKFIELFLAVLCVIALVNAAYAKTYTAKDIERLKAFADAGDPDAMNELGVFFLDGNYIYPKDIKKAVNYYKQAVKLGNIPAMSNLGYIYTGTDVKNGIPVNYNEAIELLKKSAAAGYLYAYVNLGIVYDDGLGVPKDLNLAEKYYKIAAEANVPLAQFDLGYFYSYSLNNTNKSFYWYKKAALNGYANAYSHLVPYYFLGVAVKKDFPKAYMYGKYGELLNAQGAKKSVEIILPKMSREQIAEGERLLKEYIQKHPINKN